MTYLAKPKLHHPDAAEEQARATPAATTRARSPRCAPAAGTIRSARRSSRPASSSTSPPHRVAKLSGIGCSSKTPTYFLGKSHGFNSVHGRMPSVLTGANLANRDLIYLGVSGDGDSASIGLGQFAHSMRRGVNMVYIVENNGVYGLTKGQFSATADKGSKSKRGRRSTPTRPIDMVSMALQLGATFVARSFSGDKDAAGAAHQGGDAAPGRRLHRRHQPLRGVQQPRRLDQELRLRARAQRGGEPARRHHRRAPRSPPTTRRGRSRKSRQHDGSVLRLRKLHEDYDAARPHRRDDTTCRSARPTGEIVTGLLYVDPEPARPARASQHGGHAVQSARRARALPGCGRARQVQRFAALACRRRPLHV